MSYENDKLELQKILDDEKTDSELKKMAEIELKNADLENKLLQSTVELEQIKAKTDPGSALYNVYLEKGIEDGLSGAEAQRFAEYHTTTKEELRQKVGTERIGGIIDFDMADEKQLRKRLPKLKNKVGHYFFDPYDGKIKKLVSRNGQLGFEEFNSVAEITLVDNEIAETSTKSPYTALDTTAAEVPVEEDIFARRFP